MANTKLTLSIETKDKLTDLQKEELAENIKALIKDVRPDLVQQGINTKIKSIDIDELYRT
ncbi:hypothetical protein [Priestia aryabhattai]